MCAPWGEKLEERGEAGKYFLFDVVMTRGSRKGMTSGVGKVKSLAKNVLRDAVT